MRVNSIHTSTEGFLGLQVYLRRHLLETNPVTISVARQGIMSINVLNHNDAVKTKVVICASLVLFAVLSSAEAGPRAGVYVHGGGARRPSVRAICPPVRVFPPVVCRAWPVYYYPATYSWAPSPVASFTSFSNISPAFDDGEPGIYGIPTPVIPAPPIIKSPGSTFRWPH
jgi:hypothetical protein